MRFKIVCKIDWLLIGSDGNVHVAAYGVRQNVESEDKFFLKQT